MAESRRSLEGKTALITGASRNIGRAIALAFAGEGADLVLNTRVNGDELQAVADECRKAGARVVPALADIGDAAAVESMVGRGLAELGAIDVLVCNAAIRPHTPITETSLEDWHRVMAVDLHSAFYLARAVVPGITERRYAEWYPEFKQTPPGDPAQVKEIPLRRLGRPEDIADACVFLASEASSYVTGDTIRVMGGRVIG